MGGGFQRIRIPQHAWYGDTEAELTFPRSWHVQLSDMAGNRRPPMGDDEIRDCLRNPIGCPSLRQLAMGRREAVILFDDLTRPTPVFRLIPFILEELEEGKIGRDHIRFVAAVASHRAMTGQEMVKKLGEDVVANFPVYNHNPYEGNRFLGKTQYGTPVRINREVTRCDLKIGIGSILPHNAYEFGGGAKIIMPGVAALSSSFHNHFHVRKQGGREGDRESAARRVREDMEEAARIAGLDMKIDCIINPRREVIALFAGDVGEAFKEGCRCARNAYVSPRMGDADVAVVNTYPIESEPIKSREVAISSVREGGDIVFVANSADGLITHYLYDRFGSGHGGRLWKFDREVAIGGAARVMVYSPKRFGFNMEPYGPKGKTQWVGAWEKVVDELERTHGPGARVAVYPYAPLQMTGGPSPSDFPGPSGGYGIKQA